MGSKAAKRSAVQCAEGSQHCPVGTGPGQLLPGALQEITCCRRAGAGARAPSAQHAHAHMHAQRADPVRRRRGGHPLRAGLTWGCSCITAAYLVKSLLPSMSTVMHTGCCGCQQRPSRAYQGRGTTRGVVWRSSGSGAAEATGGDAVAPKPDEWLMTCGISKAAAAGGRRPSWRHGARRLQVGPAKRQEATRAGDRRGRQQLPLPPCAAACVSSNPVGTHRFPGLGRLGRGVRNERGGTLHRRRAGRVAKRHRRAKKHPSLLHGHSTAGR